MKKIILLITVIFILLCLGGCKTKKSEPQNETVVITMPTDNSVNGYRVDKPKTESKAQSSSSDKKTNKPTNSLYYANKNSKKFHLSSCGSVETISNDNLYLTEDRAELINGGYSPCARCKP